MARTLERPAKRQRNATPAGATETEIKLALPLSDPAGLAQRVVRNARPGGIVVFHDTRRCAPVLKPALPLVLAALTERGMPLRALPPKP